MRKTVSGTHFVLSEQVMDHATRVDVEPSSPTRGAVLSSLHVRLADCATKLERTFHDSKNAPGLMNSVSAQVQTSSLCLKHIPRHAQIEIHAADILDLSIVVWQKYVVSTEQLTNEILHTSGRAWTPGGLYAAEQERDLHGLLDKLDHIQNALQASVQIYHREERTRRSFDGHNHATRSIMRRDHGHQYLGIEMQGNARAHFGDSIFYGDMYVVQSGTSSQQTAAVPEFPVAPRLLFADSEEKYAQFHEQMAAMREEFQTQSTHIRDELSLIRQQTGPQQSLILDQTRPRLMGKEQIEESKEHAQEPVGRGHAHRQFSKRAAFRMRFQLPTLFTSRVWEIARIDAHQGWDLCFRTYNRRPSNAEIFSHCERSNLTRVQELIQNGEASLLDVDEDGHNLFWVGSTKHNSLGSTDPRLRSLVGWITILPSTSSNGYSIRT